MNEVLWQRVEAALDAHLDPFELPELASALAQEPELERAVRRLVDRLNALQCEPVLADRARSSTPLWRRPSLVAAAALLLLAGLGFVAWRARTHTHPTAATAPRPRVDTVSLVVQHNSPPPARGARVVLETRPITTWTLEGSSR